MKMRFRALSFSHALPVRFGAAAASVSEDDDHGPLSKRSRLSSSPSLSPQPQYNLLGGPSPLGLRLKKSPSLLDLIQMRLSQSNDLPVAGEPGENANNGNEEDVKGTATSSTADKLKASNFIGSSLKIGDWEFISRHEGDLVAKCYFAKKKLVWEVLQGGLKSKIEMQWSDIIGLKANCPDNCPGTLTIVLARPPLFFKETNPQPRKHTLWQTSADFTEGQASRHRHHFLQCSPGILNKHFEKLIQSDPRLKCLNQQHDLGMDSLYFDARLSVTENPDDRSCIELHSGEVSPISFFPDGASPSISELSSMNHEQFDTKSFSLSKDAPSPSSGTTVVTVMDGNAIEGGSNSNQSDAQTPKSLEQCKVGGHHKPMSVTDIMNHIGHQICGRVIPGNIPTPSDKASESQGMFDSVAQMLLSDIQNNNIATSDERVMKKVNSLCCLLEGPVSCGNHLDAAPVTSSSKAEGLMWEINGNRDSVDAQTQTRASISGKDSFGDVLLYLPRVASLPKFLDDIEEANEK